MEKGSEKVVPPGEEKLHLSFSKSQSSFYLKRKLSVFRDQKLLKRDEDIYD